MVASFYVGRIYTRTSSEAMRIPGNPVDEYGFTKFEAALLQSNNDKTRGPKFALISANNPLTMLPSSVGLLI